MAARFLVHDGRKRIGILERQRPGCRGPIADVVVVPLQMRKLFPGVLSEDEGHQAGPAPKAHIGNRVAVADEVAAVLEPRVENPEMALGFVKIALLRVRDFFGPEMDEVNGLSGKRPDAGCYEHEPGQKLAARRQRVLRQELACLLRKIEQNGIAVEDRLALIDDDRNFAVRVERKEIRVELLAAPRVDRDRLIGSPASSRKSATFVGFGEPLK